MLWVAWCGYGIHAVLLQITAFGGGTRQQQISVYHVASGTATRSRACFFLPDVDGPDGEASTERYVTSGANAALVPASSRGVILCRLPGLEQVAHLVSPVVAGVPTTLVSMGWAAQGCLIAIAWLTSAKGMAVTVHSGSDGQLLHTLHPKPRTLRELRWGVIRFQAFGLCPDQPAAAVAWTINAHSFVYLLSLTRATCTPLKRPTVNASGHCYCAKSAKWYDFHWAPRGRHLMVHEIAGLTFETQDWAMFATASGEWCGLPSNPHRVDDPPVWSSDGTLCLLGKGASVLDLSANPPVELFHFGCLPEVQDIPKPDRCAFVPGTKHLVQFMVDLHADCSRSCWVWDPIDHWVYNASTRRSMRHTVPGLRGNPDKLLKSDMAWHSTLKAPAASLYAVAERSRKAAVHLIDAGRHERLVTWTSGDLAAILQEPSSLGAPCIAWSPCGQMLAIVNCTGTVIISFASSPGEQLE